MSATHDYQQQEAWPPIQQFGSVDFDIDNIDPTLMEEDNAGSYDPAMVNGGGEHGNAFAAFPNGAQPYGYDVPSHFLPGPTPPSPPPQLQGGLPSVQSLQAQARQAYAQGTQPVASSSTITPAQMHNVPALAPVAAPVASSSSSKPAAAPVSAIKSEARARKSSFMQKSPSNSPPPRQQPVASSSKLSSNAKASSSKRALEWSDIQEFLKKDTKFGLNGSFAAGSTNPIDKISEYLAPRPVASSDSADDTLVREMGRPLYMCKAAEVTELATTWKSAPMRYRAELAKHDKGLEVITYYMRKGLAALTKAPESVSWTKAMVAMLELVLKIRVTLAAIADKKMHIPIKEVKKIQGIDKVVSKTASDVMKQAKADDAAASADAKEVKVGEKRAGGDDASSASKKAKTEAASTAKPASKPAAKVAANRKANDTDMSMFGTTSAPVARPKRKDPIEDAVSKTLGSTNTNILASRSVANAAENVGAEAKVVKYRRNGQVKGVLKVKWKPMGELEMIKEIEAREETENNPDDFNTTELEHEGRLLRSHDAEQREEQYWYQPDELEVTWSTDSEDAPRSPIIIETQLLPDGTPASPIIKIKPEEDIIKIKAYNHREDHDMEQHNGHQYANTHVPAEYTAPVQRFDPAALGGLFSLVAKAASPAGAAAQASAPVATAPVLPSFDPTKLSSLNALIAGTMVAPSPPQTFAQFGNGPAQNGQPYGHNFQPPPNPYGMPSQDLLPFPPNGHTAQPPYMQQTNNQNFGNPGFGYGSQMNGYNNGGMNGGGGSHNGPQRDGGWQRGANPEIPIVDTQGNKRNKGGKGKKSSRDMNGQMDMRSTDTRPCQFAQRGENCPRGPKCKFTH